MTEAESILWIPDDSEEKDPALHARNCKKRWGIILNYMRELQRSNREIRMFLLIITILVTVNASPRIADIIHAIAVTILGK